MVDVAIIEHNQYGCTDNNPVGSYQCIFWGYNGRVRQYRTGDVVGQAIIHPVFSGGSTMWYWHSGRPMRIKCPYGGIILTWSKGDPEVEDRKRLPMSDRKPIFTGRVESWGK